VKPAHNQAAASTLTLKGFNPEDEGVGLRLWAKV
jgi:hypothetical protein